MYVCICMYVCVCICVYVCIYVCVYAYYVCVCMHNILGDCPREEISYPKREGELSGGIVLHPGISHDEAEISIQISAMAGPANRVTNNINYILQWVVHSTCLVRYLEV